MVDDLAEGFTSLPAGAGSAGLLGGVAEGDRGPHHFLSWYAEYLSGRVSARAGEPTYARANAVRVGG